MIMLVAACVAHVLLMAAASAAKAAVDNSTQSCAHLYKKGVDAYLENNYRGCVEHLELALARYRDYSATLQKCRLMCREEAELSPPLYPVDVDNLLFYEHVIKTTLCIVKCRKGHNATFTNYNINKDTEKVFEQRKPYEYLHICYYQMKNPQKAASAAFTYLVSHPNDKVMSSNLKYYSEMKDVNMKQVVNYEAKDHVHLYIYGADAHERGDWTTVQEKMEESLVAYLREEDVCRAQCEGPFDHGWYPDFIPSIANHFTYCLRCKSQCRTKLNSLNGEEYADLLPSHYHYLQYAYHKTDKLKEACEAVASYLLFFPHDETMFANIKYYRTLPMYSEDFFKPRPEAVHYVQRQTYEQRLLHFIFSEFSLSHFSNREETVKDVVKEFSFRVTLTEQHLHGPNRFVSEGLATEGQCRALLDVARMYAVLGDGYMGRQSPHTLMEKFEGITLSRTMQLVQQGVLDWRALLLYLELTENARQRVQEYFRLEKLYFTYTHLACRSALPDSPANRTDLSHDVHADNCNIFRDGECVKAPPAYSWRDYSAIIYLNNDFDGGEFIFSRDPAARVIQSTIKPKCGRMIAFSAGSENLHGVKAVRKGSRCAVGIWFTFDARHIEPERNLAYQMLKN